jgi:transmembrane sensor
VLRDARRRGLGQVLDRAPAADVMALAEAARLSRQDALARRSLGVLVGRFPRSPQGDKARFLLGRMAEDLDGDLPAALRLYDDYLGAAPAGPYRDEALGRQMTATLKLAGADRARPLAAAYLRRYPQGAYAAPARAILERTP